MFYSSLIGGTIVGMSKIDDSDKKEENQNEIPDYKDILDMVNWSSDKIEKVLSEDNYENVVHSLLINLESGLFTLAEKKLGIKEPKDIAAFFLTYISFMSIYADHAINTSYMLPITSLKDKKSVRRYQYLKFYARWSDWGQVRRPYEEASKNYFWSDGRSGLFFGARLMDFGQLSVLEATMKNLITRDEWYGDTWTLSQLYVLAYMSQPHVQEKFFLNVYPSVRQKLINNADISISCDELVNKIAHLTWLRLPENLYMRSLKRLMVKILAPIPNTLIFIHHQS